MKFLLFLIALCGAAGAHNMPGSAVALDFAKDAVDAELILPLQELELSFKQPLMDAPATVIERHGDALRSYIREHIHPFAADGCEWEVAVGTMSLQLAEEPYDLIAEVRMTPPPGADTRKFRLNYSVINHEVMSHHATVTVRNDWDAALFNGAEPLGMLQFVVTYLDIDRAGGSWTQGFRSVFHHGMQHISQGTDHLLFLVVLILPAPLLAAGKRWGTHAGLKPTATKLLKITTAFTLGHSLTLAAAGLGLVRLPSQPVEVMVAVSILVSAVHAIRPVFAGKEAWIAAGFGLVHGLAFAGTLADYGFSKGYMAMTLLAFNLGIEAMQLLVVAAIIPGLLLVARSPIYSWLRPAGAAIASLAALVWIAERVPVLESRRLDARQAAAFLHAGPE